MSDDPTAILGGVCPEQGDLFDAMSRLRLEFNDRDHGRRLKAMLDGQLLYVSGRGWGAWNGQYFDFQFGEEMALDMATEALPRAIRDEAAAKATMPIDKLQVDAWISDHPGKSEADALKALKAASVKRYEREAVKCGNKVQAQRALDLAKSSFRAEVADLDAEPFKLVCANGVLDLDALKGAAPEAEEPEERTDRLNRALGPFDPSLRNTRRPAVPFDAEAECPRWRCFIKRAMPNPIHAAFLKRCLAACLSGRNELQIALLLLGQGGNGKSTTTNAIAHVLGGYAATCRIDMFIEAKFSNGSGATPEEAVLPGGRVYIASEPETGAVLSSSKIKGLTGGESRQSRANYAKPFTWVPNGVPLLSFNKMPRVTDESEGMWRRLVPIAFPVKLHELPAEERVTPAQMEQIIAEEASGILNWLLEGWIELNERGLDLPIEAQQRKEALRAMADPVGEFLSACTTSGHGLRVRTSELHKAFRVWCEAEGFQAMGPQKFASAMFARDFTKVKASHEFWQGLELRDRSLLEPESPH